MKLKYLLIEKYKRFSVSGIKKFEYMPDKNMQIVLASNGAGKSSLMKEIIPNVEDLNKEYDEGGLRIAKYIHNGKEFELSYYRDSNKHSFKINGEELNEVGLKKTQKILIEEYFGINKHIHEMLLSTTTFTNMSVSERKKWFTEILTSIEYKEALNYYNKTKLKIKDLTSFIKLLKSKILNIETKLKEENIDIGQLSRDKEMFNELFKFVVSRKKDIEPMKEIDFNKLDLLNKEIELLIIDLQQYELTSEEANSKILKLNFDINYLKERISKIDDELKKLDEYKITDLKNINLIKEEFNKLKERMDKVEERVNMSFKDYILYIERFNNVYPELTEILNKIQEYKGIDYSYEVNQKLLKKKELLSKQYEKITNEILNVDKALHAQITAKNSNTVTCPKCSHEFKPGFNEEILKHLEKEINELLKQKDLLLKDIEKTEEEFNKVTTLEHHVSDLYNLLMYNDLLDIYKMLEKETDNFKNNENITNLINDVILSFPDIDNLKKELDRFEKLQEEIKIYDNINLNKLEYINKKKQELIEERLALIDKINNLHKEREKLNRLKNKFLDLKYKKDKLEKIMKYLKKYKQYKEDLIINEYIDKLTFLIVNETNKIDEKINEYKNLISNKEKYEEELKEYEKDLESYKKLEEYLSPTKGIIGVSISNTINVILEKMNYIINQIWSYEINILPCNVEESDLTFRFPVLINNVKEIPDVSKGSSSIKEVIDLAFKITAMEFLNMLDYPLILDEFGRTMDPVHRVKAYDYIERLSKEYFSQIFIISHFESMYSRFNNADVIVLDNSNIEYSGEYNKVAKIQ